MTIDQIDLVARGLAVVVLGGIIHANLSRLFGDVEESEHPNLALLYAGLTFPSRMSIT
jgi:hypothetical protein